VIRGRDLEDSLKPDEGIGTCGKDGQSVPVGVGMPTIKLDKMAVGASAAERMERSVPVSKPTETPSGQKLTTKTTKHRKVPTPKRGVQKPSNWKRVLQIGMGIVAGVGVVFGTIKAGVDLFEKRPSQPNMIIEHEWSYSHFLEPGLREVPSSLTWYTAFSITNLESKPIGITAVDPHFEAVSYEGHTWEVNAQGGSLAEGQEFHSRDKVYDKMIAEGGDNWTLEDTKSSSFEPADRPPFIVKPGEKSHFVFELILRVYRDGQLCSGDDCGISDNDNLFLTTLIGGHLDHSGKAWCVRKLVPFTFELDDHRRIRTELPAYIGVPGWVGPVIAKTPGGALYIQPPPD